MLGHESGGRRASGRRGATDIGPLLHSGIDLLGHVAILPDSQGSGIKPVPVHNVIGALADDRVDHYGSRRMSALNEAFRSRAGWAKFVHTITAKQAATTAWLAANADTVAAQVATRHLLPDHHSTAALDAHLGTVRDYLDARSFVLRNQRRTTAMLGLVRLHLNGVDNAGRYAALLRAWLDSNHGAAPRPRASYDTGTAGSIPAEQRLPASLRR